MSERDSLRFGDPAAGSKNCETGGEVFQFAADGAGEGLPLGRGENLGLKRVDRRFLESVVPLKSAGDLIEAVSYVVGDRLAARPAVR